MKRLKIIIWLVNKLIQANKRRDAVRLLIKEFLPDYHLRRNPVQKKRIKKEEK